MTASVTYILAAVAVCAAITFALRALPFALLKPLQDSAFLEYLRVHMPLGIMVILVAYTLLGTELAPLPLTATAAALAVTVGLHAWRGNAVLSMFVGTGVYVVLMSVLG